MTMMYCSLQERNGRTTLSATYSPSPAPAPVQSLSTFNGHVDHVRALAVAYSA